MLVETNSTYRPEWLSKNPHPSKRMRTTADKLQPTLAPRGVLTIRNVARLLRAKSLTTPVQGSLSQVLWKTETSEDPQERKRWFVLKTVEPARRLTDAYFQRELVAYLAVLTTPAAEVVPRTFNLPDHPQLLTQEERSRYSKRHLLLLEAGYASFESMKKTLCRVAETGFWTQPSVLVLLFRTALALAKLHEAGVSHGDLKLDNVVLFPKPASGGSPDSSFSSDDEWIFDRTQVKLIDFGFSQVHASPPLNDSESDFLAHLQHRVKYPFEAPGELATLEARHPKRLLFYQHVGNASRNRDPSCFQGTAASASPSHLAGDHKALTGRDYFESCCQDDVWALGVCFFTILLGKSPLDVFDSIEANVDFDRLKTLARSTSKMAVALANDKHFPSAWVDLFRGVFDEDPKARWTARQVVDSKAFETCRWWHSKTLKESPL